MSLLTNLLNQRITNIESEVPIAETFTESVKNLL